MSFEEFEILSCFLVERDGLAQQPTSHLRESLFHKVLLTLIMWHRKSDLVIAKGKDADNADISRIEEMLYFFRIFHNGQHLECPLPFLAPLRMQ